MRVFDSKFKETQPLCCKGNVKLVRLQNAMEGSRGSNIPNTSFFYLLYFRYLLKPKKDPNKVMQQKYTVIAVSQSCTCCTLLNVVFSPSSMDEFRRSQKGPLSPLGRYTDRQHNLRHKSTVVILLQSSSIPRRITCYCSGKRWRGGGKGVCVARTGARAKDTNRREDLLGTKRREKSRCSRR